jgi:hypothetical protein
VFIYVYLDLSVSNFGVGRINFNDICQARHALIGQLHFAFSAPGTLN